MADKVVNTVAESEELYNTEDLLSENLPDSSDILKGTNEEEEIEADDEDQGIDEDDHETYETDEELLEESENLESILEADEEELANEDIEHMEEDLEVTETDGEPVKAKSRAQVRLPELPLSKVKHIIKLDPDVKLVSSEAVYLVAKATEHFIRSLAKEAHNHAAQQKKKTLTKSHVDQALAMLPIEL